MQFDDAINILKRHEADLKNIGVNSLYIFGYTVRGDQREDSDVDMFFDYDTETLSILELLRSNEQHRSILAARPIFSTRDGLDQRLRADIEISS